MLTAPALLPPADTNKVRVTFPEASQIAEEVRTCLFWLLQFAFVTAVCTSGGAAAADDGVTHRLKMQLLWCPDPSCLPLAPLHSWLPQLLKTEFDTARIIYNRFVSAIAQKPTIATVLSPDVS